MSDVGYSILVKQVSCQFPETTTTTATVRPTATPTTTPRNPFLTTSTSPPAPPTINPRFCSGTFVAPARLTSPGFLSGLPSYPRDSYCEYRVLLNGGGDDGVDVCFVRLDFVVFDLELSLDCNKDFLQVTTTLLADKIE